MKRKPKPGSRRPKSGRPSKQVQDHVEYLEAMIRVVERHPRVKTAKFGEVVIAMGPAEDELPDAIGFEMPLAGEDEDAWESDPEET